MNKLLTVIAIIQLLIILAVGYLLYNRPIQVVETPARITRYDITKFCQELSAQANENWGYKSCLEEMEKAAKEDLLKGSETI